MMIKDAATPSLQRGASVLAGLSRGLPNFWYPILRSAELHDKPACVTRFGEDFAVWRDGAGRPHVFENRCPHRGAKLSQGKAQGNELACAYHGWRFDEHGECVAMPLEAAASAGVRRYGVKSYAAEDRGGYVWMFWGDRMKAMPLSVPVELEDEERLNFATDYRWQTNWINILDNILDPLHAIFLHAGAVTQRKRASFRNFEITHSDERGFRLGKIGLLDDGSVGPVEGEVEFLLPNIVRLDIANGTSQGIYRVVIMSTPIDENSSYAFYARSRRGQGWKRLQWKLWWLAHGRAVDRVAVQDRDIMSGLGPITEARPREHLASSDIGVVRLRRRLEEAFLAGQSEANEPPLEKRG